MCGCSHLVRCPRCRQEDYEQWDAELGKLSPREEDIQVRYEAQRQALEHVSVKDA